MGSFKFQRFFSERFPSPELGTQPTRVKLHRRKRNKARSAQHRQRASACVCMRAMWCARVSCAPVLALPAAKSHCFVVGNLFGSVLVVFAFACACVLCECVCVCTDVPFVSVQILDISHPSAKLINQPAMPIKAAVSTVSVVCSSVLVVAEFVSHRRLPSLFPTASVSARCVCVCMRVCRV